MSCSWYILLPWAVALQVVKTYDFVEAHMTDAAYHQQRSYNQHLQQRSCQVGDTVWLDVPSVRKLDAKWEWGWIVKDAANSKYLYGDEETHSAI